MAGLKLLRLTTIGRKTGREYTTPLYYFEHKGKYIVIASAGVPANIHPGSLI